MRPNDMPRPFAPDHGEEAPRSERLRLCDAWRVAGEKGLLSELIVGARMVVCLEEDDAEIALLKRTSAEIERECREGWKQATHWRVQAEAAEREIAGLRAQVEALRPNERRYQWLRKNTAMKELFSSIEHWRGVACGFWPDRRHEFELDTAIDVAIDAARSESALVGKG